MKNAHAESAVISTVRARQFGRDKGRIHVKRRTRTRAPQAVVSTPIQLQLFQVTRTRGRDQPDVDIGTPADDLLYDLHGFHGPERDRDPDRGTFRWTGPQASLTLPGGEAVTLVVAGPRPPGTPPAEISVWIGEQLVGERVLGETPQAIRLALPETGAPGPIDLTIQSTVFHRDPLACRQTRVISASACIAWPSTCRASGQCPDRRSRSGTCGPRPTRVARCLVSPGST